MKNIITLCLAMISVAVFAESENYDMSKPAETAENDVSGRASAAVTALTVFSIFLFAGIVAVVVLIIIMLNKKSGKK